MSSTSILRNGLASPARSMMTQAGSARAVLKRPGALALPQTPPAAACFSLHYSPLKSPHVHFPPSPGQMVATFTAHSAASYDRAPISISPNPLEMPGRGERVWSPSTDSFRLAAVPRAFRTLAFQDSPVMSEFEDPRSPKIQPAATKANNVRFGQLSKPAAHAPRDASRSLTTYPRSPYPSAPLNEQDSDSAQDWPSDRAASLQTMGKRNKNGLSIGGAAVFASADPVQSPQVTSIKRTKKPAPLPLESSETDKLNQAFWNSVCLDSANQVMVTALEYPESAVEFQEKQEMVDQTAGTASIMYADASGALWSPAVPRPGVALNRIRDSLMSPAINKPMRAVVRREVTAPSPNDPFAAFPSFAAVLQMNAA
ncbi:hypothetical protein BJ165DRAFT_1398474 [Panaeolus papilionaceus]|nr:hypothetical protein BJ165DRAFT_1398474 [Panaeolus papilionaceus]